VLGDGVRYPRLSWECSAAGDFDCPDGVGLEDLTYLAERWLLQGDSAGAADAEGGEKVNLTDFGILNENCLK
jgi:hypothetical protein